MIVFGAPKACPAAVADAKPAAPSSTEPIDKQCRLAASVIDIQAKREFDGGMVGARYFIANGEPAIAVTLKPFSYDTYYFEGMKKTVGEQIRGLLDASGYGDAIARVQFFGLDGRASG